MWATSSSADILFLKGATGAAFLFDDCDLDSSVGDRRGERPDISYIADRVPDISEAEPITSSLNSCGHRSTGVRSPVSGPSHQWTRICGMIVLLAMSTGKIKLVVGGRWRWPVQRIGGGIRFLWRPGRSSKSANSKTAVDRRGLLLTSRVGDPMRTTRSVLS